MISLEEARRRFLYDPETGVITRKITTSGTGLAGSIAGRIARDGYRNIGIGIRRVQAHRLAWFIFYGEWPKHELDHINGMRDDNRISNLREVSHDENQKNLKLSKSNTSGVVGVVYNKKAGKWQAQIKAPDRHIHLGVFSKFEDAVCARKKAEVDLGFHPNHGAIKQEAKP